MKVILSESRSKSVQPFNYRRNSNYTIVAVVSYSSELSLLHVINENATQLPAFGDQGQDNGVY